MSGVPDVAAKPTLDDLTIPKEVVVKGERYLPEWKLVASLAAIYRKDTWSRMIADLCDEYLDPSGRLLGLVRDHVRRQMVDNNVPDVAAKPCYCDPGVACTPHCDSVPATWRPDWAHTCPPGETLTELLEMRGWTQAHLARTIVFSQKHVNEIVKGKKPISVAFALALEAQGMGTAEFWMSRDSQYQVALARHEKEAKS